MNRMKKIFKNKFFRIGIILVISLVVFMTGYYDAKKFQISHKLKIALLGTLNGMAEKKIDVPKDYLRGVFSKPENISIEFTSKDFEVLMSDRKVAMERGILLDDHNSEVATKISYNGEKFKATAKLKGDFPDHFADEKFSLRIDLKGNKKIKKLDKFALQQPKVRSFLREWICHMMEEKEDLIHLTTYYVSVTINGKKMGIYQMEEYFDDTIITNNQLPEGIIFRQLGPGKDLKIFNEKQIYSSVELTKILTSLFEKYDAFTEGKIPLNEVFDVAKLAKWYAIVDLVRGHHALYNCNLHFYFNSEKQLIEPIGREWNLEDFAEIQEISIDMINNPDIIEDNPLDYWLHKKIFTDELFLNEYYKALVKISNPTYLDEFFNTISEEMELNLSILYKDYPFYSFNKPILYWNQKIIQKKLEPERPIKAYSFLKEGKQLVYVKNLSAFPLVLKSIVYNDDKVKIQNKMILFSGIKDSINTYQSINLPFKIEDLRVNSELVFSFLGAEKELKCKILPWGGNEFPIN